MVITLLFKRNYTLLYKFTINLTISSASLLYTLCSLLNTRITSKTFVLKFLKPYNPKCSYHVIIITKSIHKWLHNFSHKVTLFTTILHNIGRYPNIHNRIFNIKHKRVSDLVIHITCIINYFY